METETTTVEAVKKHSMEEIQIAHLAGAFDVAGVLNVHITKDDEYRIGYRMSPLCSMTFPVERDNPFLGKMISYCEDENVQYYLTEIFNDNKEKSKSQRIEIKDPYSLEAFLLPMLDHLVTHYESAIIMLEQITPRIKDDLHKEKEGFYEIMGFADVLRQKSNHTSRTKYDQEYFAEEWSIVQ